MKSNCKQVWYLTSMVGIWDAVIEPHGDLIVRKAVCAPEAILNRSRLSGFIFSIDTVDLFFGSENNSPLYCCASRLPPRLIPPFLPLLLPSLPQSQKNNQPKPTKTCCLDLSFVVSCWALRRGVQEQRRMLVRCDLLISNNRVLEMKLLWHDSLICNFCLDPSFVEDRLQTLWGYQTMLPIVAKRCVASCVDLAFMSCCKTFSTAILLQVISHQACSWPNMNS